MSEVLSLSDHFPMAGEYLLQMYLIERDYGKIGNAALADRLGVSRSAVSQALKRLVAHDYVENHVRGSYLLTASGRKIAIGLLRRHYLIEHLLVRSLDYPWDLADQEAARLQDKISREFCDFLFEKMGRPETCPHGNPFPDSAIESQLLGAKRLAHLPAGKSIRILRITEEGEGVPQLLSFCYKNKLQPGKIFHISRIEKGTYHLTDESGKEISIPRDFTEFIRVEMDPE